MKTQRASLSKRGFTLMELMVAMAITTIIVTVLVSITSIAIDTWNRSRSELRAARQAKSMVETMARDFEALVTRSGNENEWLSAAARADDASTNAVDLVFFSAATDRYNGQIGVTGVDNGGDVSCVGYKLKWKDPIDGGSSGDFETFVLNRLVVNPDDTFKDLLGQSTLSEKFDKGTKYGDLLEEPENFVCENVFQFTVTFHVEVPPASGTGAALNRLVTISTQDGVQKFSIKGSGIVTDPADLTLTAGRVTGVEISLTVLSDSGINLLGRPGNSSKAKDPAWLAKNSYNYSKLVQLPGM